MPQHRFPHHRIPIFQQLDFLDCNRSSHEPHPATTEDLVWQRNSCRMDYGNWLSPLSQQRNLDPKAEDRAWQTGSASWASYSFYVAAFPGKCCPKSWDVARV